MATAFKCQGAKTVKSIENAPRACNMPAMSKKHKKTKGKKKAKPRAKPSAEPRAKGIPDVKGMVSLVAGHLAARGHEVILVGRACAAVYAGSRAKLPAVEFVVSDFVVNDVLAAMSGLGFSSRDERTFTSKKFPYEIVLNPPPITVGDDVVENVSRIKMNGRTIGILTPTDCVRHRLSVFYKWGEREGIDDAVRVAKKQKVDMKLVERWSNWEWCRDKFLEFAERV